MWWWTAVLCTAGCATAGSPENEPENRLDSDAGCTVEQLLANADFDSGAGQGWMWESSETSYDLITPAGDLPMPPHSQEYVAWLGGIEGLSERFYQTVTVPPGARGLELSGYRWIRTDESSDTAVDRLDITLRDPSDDTLLETLHAWSNVDEDDAWTPFLFAAGGGYAGRTLRLQFESFNSGDDVTSFFLDTLAVQAMVCQPSE